jgi:hypothetical protein
MNHPKHFFAAKSLSRYYAITYLACIPAFAWFYSFISTDFYHETAKHERSVANDLNAIQEGIERAFNHQIAVQYENSQVVSNGWVLSGNKVGIGSLGLKDGVFSCSVTVIVERKKGHSPERLKGTLATMTFDPFSLPMIKDNGKYETVMKSVNIRLDGFADFNPYVMLANPRAGFTGTPPEIHFLPISTQLDRQILAYSQAANGFPAHSSGTNWRMFYLSAATTTTLGYGDILPVTDRARMAVSLEAILGIVIIGYYLASLATSPNGCGI